jgi:hypothetical protein
MPPVFRLRSRSSLSSGPATRSSRNLTSAAALLVLFLVGGMVTFLATTDMKPPVKTLEKVLPDDRFPR